MPIRAGLNDRVKSTMRILKLSSLCKRCLQQNSRTLWRPAAHDPSLHRSFSTMKAEGFEKLEYETQVLSFGDGSNGALGHDAEGYLRDAFEPVPVQGLPKNIMKVAAGHYHSLAVTNDGEVWAWGRNSEGQLARRHGNSREDWRHPRRVDGLENIRVKDVGGSGVVSMVIAEDGSLWSWGSSKRGQLGLSPDSIQCLLPQRVESLSGYQVSQVLRLH
ncbi:hypothetical protein R1flu_001678 [Riccia fluitans]|uniref:Uncharacterized protein n=1 Tax=Riccia fluitans TaxID=41844 RepID=A0ABD1Y3Y9_9MARC